MVLLVECDIKERLCIILPSATERQAVCPGKTANYVCTNQVNGIGIRWRVFCRTSATETACASTHGNDLPESLDTTRSEPRTINICGSGGSTFFSFTYNFLQGVSNLSVTVPQTSDVNHIEIGCESTCRYLYYAGKIRTLYFL